VKTDSHLESARNVLNRGEGCLAAEAKRLAIATDYLSNEYLADVAARSAALRNASPAVRI
jgi:hypothetical protein